MKLRDNRKFGANVPLKLNMNICKCKYQINHTCACTYVRTYVHTHIHTHTHTHMVYEPFQGYAILLAHHSTKLVTPVSDFLQVKHHLKIMSTTLG